MTDRICDTSHNNTVALNTSHNSHTVAFITIFPPNARFTLADPMPRLGSDVVGGNSGRNHPTSRRHTIHIGRMARNVSVGTRESYNIVRLLVGTVKESYLLQLSVALYTFGSRSAGGVGQY